MAFAHRIPGQWSPINDILIVLYWYTIMSKLFTLQSDIFLECGEYQQINEYLEDKINAKEQEFLTEASAFYEKHRHDSDDSIWSRWIKIQDF